MLGQVNNQEQKLSYAKACFQESVVNRCKTVKHQKPLLKKTECRQDDEEKQKRKPNSKVC